MIELEQAVWNTRKALGKFLPDTRFVLTSFKPPLKDYETWVFRCKVKGKNESYVCKTARRNSVGRAKILNQFKRLETAFPVVNGPHLKVPEPLSFDHKFCTMIMEDAKGQSFLEKVPDFVTPSDAASCFKDAGKWLALFQSSTARTVEFQPKPHTNWLRRAIKQHQENDRFIPDFENFIEAFSRFETLDTMARNLPAQRCVTHRDFHLGNIIFKQNGSIYGIDFENDREDVALRDVASLFFDFAYRFQWENISDLKPALDKLEEGYRDRVTHPDVFQYFQAFTALNAWSNIGGTERRDHKKSHRLNVAKLLATDNLQRVPINR